MTGLHHMTNAIDITLTTKFGGTILWPMIALSNIAQGSSVLAMSVLQRHNKRAEQVNVPACISAYLGVTEPALFGVNLKYGFPLICGMIGSAVAAIVSVGSGVQALSIGVGGIPGILSINPQFWGSFGGGDCHSLCADLAGRAEEIERGGERQRARACGCRAARRLACGGGVYRADERPPFCH